MLKKLDAISAWTILVIGFAHMAAALVFFTYLVEPGASGVFREPVLWWCAGGITNWFGGALNVLRLRYGQRLPAIIRIAIAANVAMILYEIWLETNNLDFVTVPRAVLLVLQVMAFLFSVADLRRAPRVAENAGGRLPTAGAMRSYDSLFAWLIAVFAVVEGLSVFYFFQPLVTPGAVKAAREPALWWVSGNLALCFCAALNYLRLRYGSVVQPLIWVSLVSTVIMLYFVLLLLVDNPLFFLAVRVPLFVGLAGAFFGTLRSLQSAPDDRRT